MMLRKEGEQPFTAHIEAMASEAGQECIVRVVDLTNVRHSEEVLKQSESLLKEAQHLAHIGHWIIDPATGASTWSEEMFRIFGLDPGQDAPSLADREKLVHPDDLDRFNEAISKAIGEGASFDIVVRLVWADQSIRWVNTKGCADRSDEGRVIRLFGTTQDISELVRIQEELKEKQAQLKETHRLAHIGTWDWVADTDRVNWSEELYRIAGCNPLEPAPSYAEHPKYTLPIAGTVSRRLLKSRVKRAKRIKLNLNLSVRTAAPDGSMPLAGRSMTTLGGSSGFMARSRTSRNARSWRWNWQCITSNWKNWSRRGRLNWRK